METPTRTGGAVRVAHEVPEPAVGFGDGGETGPLGQRTRLPEGRDAGDDEVRVGFVEHLGAQAPPFQRARPEVFQQDVRFGNERQHGLLAGFGPEVQHHRLLVAVDGPVQHGGIALVQAPVAQLVTGSGPFHLDHFGTEVGEQPAGGGRGDVVPELQDADSLQGRDGCLCHVVLLFVGVCLDGRSGIRSEQQAHGHDQQDRDDGGHRDPDCHRFQGAPHTLPQQ